MSNNTPNLIAVESPEQLQDFAKMSTKNGRIVPPDEEIPAYMHYYMLAVVMHRLKMVDIVWFDDEAYPIVPDIGTKVIINPSEIDPSTTAEKTDKFRGMTLTGMVNLCRILEKPEWA